MKFFRIIKEYYYFILYLTNFNGAVIKWKII